MKLLKLFSAVISLILSTSASAALVERLGGLAYYDTDADLTWLADANYAQTSGINIVGRKRWQSAMWWAENLTVGGVDGWRLPTTVDVGNDGHTYTNYTVNEGVDFGYNITAHSELSNMFFNVLGNKSFRDTSGTATGCTAPDYCLTNTGPFSNIQLNSYYWSATEFAPNTASAWVFDMERGYQTSSTKHNSYYVWAVKSGDVSSTAPPAVPIPAAVWLFGSGLIGLAGFARRKKA